ncbi:MAG TPA: HD domain-containing protein [Polyangiaceae bacterium]
MWTYRRVRLTIAEDPELAALFEHAKAHLDDDPGHDSAHCLRVAVWTLCLCDGAVEPRLAIAAALLHDIVNVPKNSPERASASELSARAAAELLPRHGFSTEQTQTVTEAIRTHSFSRGEPPTNELGRFLSDADRLEALGAIGLFRTISTGVRMGARYFDADDPWAGHRPLDDRAFSVDHFFTKLLRLPETLLTERGRAEARRRAAFLRATLDALAAELATEPPPEDLPSRR